MQTFGATITLRPADSPAPDAETAEPIGEDVEEARDADRIRLADLDAVLEAAIVAHWPRLIANVTTTHTDR